MIHMHGTVWLFRLERVKGNKFIGIFFTIFRKKGVSQTDDSALKGRIFKGGVGGEHHERRRRELSRGVWGYENA